MLEQGHDDDICIFCIEPFDATEIDIEPEYVDYLSEIYTSTVTLKCKHTFHINCFIKYICHNYKTTLLNKLVNGEIINCPTCRNPITRMFFFKILKEYIKVLKASNKKLSNRIKNYNKTITITKIQHRFKNVLNKPIYLEDLRNLYTLQKQSKDLVCIKENIRYRIDLIKSIRFESSML